MPTGPAEISRPRRPGCLGQWADGGTGTIPAWRFDAVLIDLDGVVTETAGLHARAWKAAFDDVLVRCPEGGGADLRPFDLEADYRRHVDGKAREEGVRAFLQARGVRLPEGAPGDSPAALTVHGVASRKNAVYRSLLKEHGARALDDAVDFIRRVRAAGLKCAAVSSSRNAAVVLESAGLAALFDLRVDGNDLAAGGLAGKPSPDLFLQAAERAGVMPARAVVLEDSLAGVEAGRAGGFGMVVGVARSNTAAALRESGADVAVADLRVVAIDDDPGRPAAALPSALDDFARIADEIAGREPVVFLDYDGTLTPIVARPDLAVLSADMRAVLRDLASLCTIAVISGRDRADVAALVGIEGIVYAGSHGFDIAGPAGRRIEHQEGTAFRDTLTTLAGELRGRLGDVPGALIEPKKYGVAVHYREVPEAHLADVEAAVDEARARHPDLHVTRGKKVYDFRPGVAWDKGKAVEWLLSALGLAGKGVVTLYLGDDLTDEDAFAAIAGSGVGILVGDHGARTRARYTLADTESVREFLNRLDDTIREWRRRR